VRGAGGVRVSVVGDGASGGSTACVGACACGVRSDGDVRGTAFVRERSPPIRDLRKNSLNWWV
jgi:hypothetical protein